MARKLGFILFLIILALCLISGGCSYPENQDITTLKELIKIPKVKDYENNILEKIKEKAEEDKPDYENNKKKVDISEDTIQIELYFGNADGRALVVEKRDIKRTEGIARLTVEELLKGPDNPQYISLFPEGSRLLDINVKPDGVCIVDLSAEATKLKSSKEEKLMVYSLTNTLAQFPTVDKVVIRIDGRKTDTIAGYVKWPEYITPDYNL